MKSTRKNVLAYILTMVGLLFLASPRVSAQSDGDNDADDRFNPAPCDFSDNFYTANGISLTQLNTAAAGRFGNFRKFGPPSRNPNQPNWVADEDNCFEKDPTRRDIRVLATTGGYVDDGTGSPTDFISIIAFLQNQNFFLPSAQTGGAGKTAQWHFRTHAMRHHGDRCYSLLSRNQRRHSATSAGLEV